MTPRKDTPDLWSYWIFDSDSDLSCWISPDLKEEWNRIWIISLQNEQAGYDSAEWERLVWKAGKELVRLGRVKEVAND